MGRDGEGVLIMMPADRGSVKCLSQSPVRMKSNVPLGVIPSVVALAGLLHADTPCALDART